MKCDITFPLPLPDDPHKWDGWSKYRSANYYERLCLDPAANPAADTIEEHCRELLRWWQKKLPLKNQPSNPLAQLLRSGLDESSRFLTEARVELLDPTRRQKIDDELAAQAQEEAAIEFHKYLTFALADGTLTLDEEKNLLRFGSEHGLPEERMLEYIEAELRDSNAKRITPAPIPIAEVPAPPAAPSANGHVNGSAKPRSERRRRDVDPKDDFMRMLRLSALDSDSMTDDQRDAFVNMAENLGIDLDEAEDLVDLYLEQADDDSEFASEEATAPAAIRTPAVQSSAAVEAPVSPAIEVPAVDRVRLVNFTNSLDGQMFVVPSGEFVMGSEAPDAAPIEKPLTRVTLSQFYLSRFPITNAQYEAFDSSHERKRAKGAGDTHPVVYVSSLDAMKFCQWLSTRERKKYRLPTEAEWEFAAKGNDNRRYPWGNLERRGDLANFADRNTVFAWSDREVDDGYPESSPVGAFPRGASPFGIEDLAGNVWEWCLDYFETYRGSPRVNPRGAASGAKRVYRGGSWKSRFNSLRTTVRGSNMPNYSCNDLGFRIVCESD